MFALKLSRAAGYKVILSSSSDEKLQSIKEKLGSPPIQTVNYRNPSWHEEVMKLTNGVGVDCVVEVGGNSSLVKSLKCTKRGGIVSSVGYLSGKDPKELTDLLSVLIDRRVILRLVAFILRCIQKETANSFDRGINAGSKQDHDDLCAAISATEMRLDDIIDSVEPFEESDAAVERVWQGKVIGKLVLSLD